MHPDGDLLEILLSKVIQMAAEDSYISSLRSVGSKSDADG